MGNNSSVKQFALTGANLALLETLPIDLPGRGFHLCSRQEIVPQ